MDVVEGIEEKVVVEAGCRGRGVTGGIEEGVG